MGATIRMTKDRRILIRNTAEVYNPFQMSKLNLSKRSIVQKIGIKKDFLNCQIILSNRLGQVLSQEQEIVHRFLRKLMTIFLWQVVIMVRYGVGTLFGEQMAIKQANNIQKKLKLLSQELNQLGYQLEFY